MTNFESDPGLPATTRALLEHLRRARFERTLLVAPAAGAGRELLRAAARADGGWSGVEVTTLRPLAIELAGPGLASAGLSVLDEFQEEALVDQVIDEVVAAQEANPYAELAGGAGFRRSVRGVIAALTTARITPEELARARLRSPVKRRLLVDVLRRFHAEMDERKLVTIAEAYRRATEAIEEGATLRAKHVLLLSGLSTRGVAGRMIDVLRERGATLLPADPVIGVERPDTILWKGGEEGSALGRLHDTSAPAADRQPSDWDDLPLFAEAGANGDADVDPQHGDSEGSLAEARARSTPLVEIFCACGIHDELTEVLRRVSALGTKWEEVEIITPDPAVYGPAFHAVAAAHGVDVTFATGLPVARTRTGTALASYFRWIGEDFPATMLHRLLIRGDLRCEHMVDGARLARRLRRLRIGWGRDRYLPAIDSAMRRLDAGEELEGEDHTAGSRVREQEELTALRSLVGTLLDAAPREIPGRVEPRPKPVSPAALARGAAVFLGHVHSASTLDETARDRLLRVLDRVSAELRRPTTFRAALAALEDHLEVRVPAPRAEGRAPWLSDGGSVHFSDLEHGGICGRPHTFLVGFDTTRFPGHIGQDPMLLDDERRAISSALPTSVDRRRDLEFRVAALLARLRGRVTLSFPVWDAATAQTLAPSSLLLRAFRHRSGDPAAGFGTLRRALGTPAGRIPRGPGAAVLGVEESWLGALDQESGFLDGRHGVREAFEPLGMGIGALESWDPDTAPNHHTGVVAPRPALALHGGPALSASRLEQLGACPRRFFLATVLGVSVPEEPEFRPDAWLDARARGGLLHRVFEQTLLVAREEGAESAEEIERVAREVLRDAARLTARELPPPSKAVMEREIHALTRDVGSFLASLPEGGAPWTELELAFGGRYGAMVEISTGKGVIRLRGRIDRVDRSPDGSLTVIDYKTGRARADDWSPTTGTFRGGRRLQHLLYSLALERIRDARVTAAEYHFPTLRGEGARIRFGRTRLEGGAGMLALLAEGVDRGWFVPTDDSSDCRFCDFGNLCGVSWSDRKLRSRAADFSQAHREAGTEEFGILDAVRRYEESS